ncbi:aldehyde dehydrogenase family protein, partial [Staphylococcus condimenti]|uniref:aldehyde dehydrogenase family protein n=1 Tax=Staphylococcus condimenti TaxID=70255 RepID=UPI0027BA85E1
LKPATNEVIETIEYTDEAAINKRIENAHNALESWKEVESHTRSQKLLAWSKLIDEHKEELAELITKEGG